MPRASSPCPKPGCWQLKPCPTHKPKPWAGSTRRATLPPDWNQRVAAVKHRSGGRCEHQGPAGRCTNRSASVDHAAYRLDHRPEALMDLCQPHHAVKTRSESTAGRWPQPTGDAP